jgi:LmbE family N-acetylglucosaminyl deacetylase
MHSISRRSVLAGAGLSAAASIEPKPAERKLKVVVSGGHPGDPEYGCGGTIARYTDLGHEVVLLYLNRGDWGPTEDAAEMAGRIRTAEAAKACEILKAHPAFAGQADGKSVVDNPRYEAFTKILAAERPDMVFTQWPIDNHADHRAISSLTHGAWLALKKSFALYYYEVSNGEDTLMFSPTHYVDITANQQRKRAACYAHASQNPDKYYSLQDTVARFRGIENGFARAEAFIHQTQSPAGLLP